MHGTFTSKTLTADWQSLLNAPADVAYEQLADLLELPRIQDFPRPGDARTWSISEWQEWGSDKSFVSGPKTRHGQMIQHKIWTTVYASPSTTLGDPRGAMNCCQDARQTLINFLERARQCCKLLAQDKEEPQGELGDWLTLKLSGAAGQTLMERSKKAIVNETPEQAFEADKLLKRLKPFYPSTRQSLVELGLAESKADSLILLNKGRTSWQFAGLAEQLIPVMKLVLGDHIEAERKALSPTEGEPEVLGPAQVARAAKPVLSEVLLDVADRTPSQAHYADELDKLAAEVVGEVNTAMVEHQSLLERVGVEVPEMIRTMRARNNVFNKLVNDSIELQVRQHAYISKLETSDLLPKLAAQQGKLLEFKTSTKVVKQMIAKQRELLQATDNKLEAATLQIVKLKAEVAKLEEQVTDPKAAHTTGKLKDIRKLLESKDMFEFVENVKRAKQMIDALIKAEE